MISLTSDGLRDSRVSSVTSLPVSAIFFSSGTYTSGNLNSGVFPIGSVLQVSVFSGSQSLPGQWYGIKLDNSNINSVSSVSNGRFILQRRS